MDDHRFEQIKTQYRRWPGDTKPNGGWGNDVAWLIDEVEALRFQLAERDEYYHMVINEACQRPDEKHCTCVPALRKKIEKQNALIERAGKLAALTVSVRGFGYEPALQFLQDASECLAESKRAFLGMTVVEKGDVAKGTLILRDASGVEVKVVNLGEDGE